MSGKQQFRLVHAEARHRAQLAVAQAPEGYVVTISEPRRSLPQNARFHALCGDLAAARVPFAGKPRTLEEWKTLLVSGHAVATKREAEVVQGIEGELVNLRESTAAMSKERGSSLIEYAQAFAASHGI